MRSNESASAHNVLGIFGMSIFTTEQKLEEIFGVFGKLDKVSIIFDRQVRRQACGWCCCVLVSHSRVPASPALWLLAARLRAVSWPLAD